MTKPWVATAVAFVAGAVMAGSLWLHEREERLRAEKQVAEYQAHLVETSPIYLLSRTTCEKQLIPCASIEKAMLSGIYWPPGTTVKECAREP